MPEQAPRKRADARRNEQALLDAAASWWPRDLTAQAWLLAWYLKRGDPREAMMHLDAIGRSRPDVLEELSGALAPLATEPVAAAALADTLTANPPWRPIFIPIVSRAWPPEAMFALLGRLQDRPPGPTPAELRTVLMKLLAAGRVDETYLAWLRSLPADQRATLGYLYNGDFRRPITDIPFDWVTPPVPSATVSVVADGDEPRIVIGFLGGRVFERPLLHDLVLAPGHYRLTGRVRTDRLIAERGVRWTIACRDSPDTALATSEPFGGTSPWRDFAVDLVVPDAECRSQVLGLEVYARAPPDRVISGIASFSKLDIRPR